MSSFWTLVRQVMEGIEVGSTSTVTSEVVRPRASDRAESRRPEILTWPSLSRPRPTERTERIRSEILMVAPHFTRHEGVYYDEANCDWLMIPQYPLPERWGSRWSELLIVFPEMYPIAPPIGFYLNRKFRLKHGGEDSHLIGTGLHNAPDLREQGWNWYCVQTKDSVAGGWRPSPNYNEPDNLHSYLNLVREVLTND